MADNKDVVPTESASPKLAIREIKTNIKLLDQMMKTHQMLMKLTLI